MIMEGYAYSSRDRPLISESWDPGIVLVNQTYELEPCLAISLGVATQSGLELSFKTANLY